MPLGPSVAQPPLPAAPGRHADAVAERRRGAGGRSAAIALAGGDGAARRRSALAPADRERAADDWLAGEIDAADVESQVRHYAAARTAAPRSGSTSRHSPSPACVRVRPQLAPCDAVDRLADWASRDTDNGVPSVLLADRARQRGQADLAASYVEQAAAARAVRRLLVAACAALVGLPAPVDDRRRSGGQGEGGGELAAQRDLPWATSLRAVCAEPGERSDRMHAACARLGEAMMTRGATFALRRAGARIAEINAAEPPRARRRRRATRAFSRRARAARRRSPISRRRSSRRRRRHARAASRSSAPGRARRRATAKWRVRAPGRGG